MGKLFNQPNKNILGKRNPNWRGGKIKYTCKVCGETYFKFPCQGGKRTKFCSKSCFYVRFPHLPYRDKKGYIWIFKPNHGSSVKNGYIKEHRFVLEKAIGRLLKSGEVVHHINGIKSDNRKENLELFSNHSEHIRFRHKKV